MTEGQSKIRQAVEDAYSELCEKLHAYSAKELHRKPISFQTKSGGRGLFNPGNKIEIISVKGGDNPFNFYLDLKGRLCGDVTVDGQKKDINAMKGAPAEFEALEKIKQDCSQLIFDIDIRNNLISKVALRKMAKITPTF